MFVSSCWFCCSSPKTTFYTCPLFRGQVIYHLIPWLKRILCGMNAHFSLLLSAVVLSVSPSCSTKYKKWSGGGVEQGAGGAYETSKGVEVWTMGSPNKPYTVIGLIEDSRPDGPLAMARRIPAIARKVKTLGGDGAFLISQRSQYQGTYQQGSLSSTWNQQSAVQATTHRSGQQAFTQGNIQTTGSTYTTGSGVSIPMYRSYGQFKVFKYVGPDS